MIRNIEINNFRGIKTSKINGFKNINLLFGKNNCGKSTLLEAIFLLSGQSNPILPIRINNIRDYDKNNKEDLELNFYGFNANNNIILSYEGDAEGRKLKISTFESKSNIINLEIKDNISNMEKGYYGIKLDFFVNEKEYHSEIILKENNVSNAKEQAKVNVDKRYNENIVCKYLPAKYPYQTAILGLKNIIEDKKEELVLNALKKINEDIKDVFIVDNDVLVDIGLEKRVPINVMGDGIRKLLAMIASIYECKGGILLIDEIDNGFHYSVMEKLWETILSMALETNTQIFATTHNKDSLIGYNNVLKNSPYYTENSIAFSLQHQRDGKLNTYSYSPEDIDYALEHDTEIR